MSKRHLVTRDNAVANLRDACTGARLGEDIAIITRSDNYLAGKFVRLTPRGRLTIRYAHGEVEYDAITIKAVER